MKDKIFIIVYAESFTCAHLISYASFVWPVITRILTKKPRHYKDYWNYIFKKYANNMLNI